MHPTDAAGPEHESTPPLPGDVSDELEKLASFSDAALFDILRAAMPVEVVVETEALLDEKGRGELSAAKQHRLDDLVRMHEVSTLERAQAALLLQRRGYDMADPAIANRLP